MGFQGTPGAPQHGHFDGCPFRVRDRTTQATRRAQQGPLNKVPMAQPASANACVLCAGLLHSGFLLYHTKFPQASQGTCWRLTRWTFVNVSMLGIGQNDETDRKGLTRLQQTRPHVTAIASNARLALYTIKKLARLCMLSRVGSLGSATTVPQRNSASRKAKPLWVPKCLRQNAYPC